MNFLQSENKMKYECHKNYQKRISDKNFFKQEKKLEDISNVNTTSNVQSEQNDKRMGSNQYKSLTLAILKLGKKKEPSQDRKLDKTDIVYPKFIIRNNENRQSSVGNGSRTFFNKVYKDLKKNGVMTWKGKSMETANKDYAEKEMNYLLDIKKKKQSWNEMERKIRRKLVISEQ